MTMTKSRTTTSKLHTVDGDPMFVRKTFAQFPSGVVVLATEQEGQKHALVASSFMVGVSLEPCLVAVAVQKSSETWAWIKNCQSVGASVFSQGQGNLTRQLASKDRAARFEEVAVEVDDSGAVFVEDASLWFECVLYNELDAGDHWIALLEVKQMGVSDNEPLIWHGAGFRGLAKPGSIASS
ncbi:flavin reductase family protein [Pseudarthrobacter phenanthrenivorans]|jgi:flavin reductase (DIM6/NTAB) family NADH-FMN oxidoreductase RutF|uniref:flavin reductase family protein n=1 Tax=Pseudarthrobacter phenanthrenivorans TaxID=361575 RepID=UPI002F35EBCF